jgi:CelD/BcsL family acetyltransferase involved in cellulose biosynthesis
LALLGSPGRRTALLTFPFLRADMELYTFDPSHDNRWDDFAGSHPRASIFQQSAWLRALVLTYGFRPLIVTSTRPGQPLTDGIAFCEVRSWITGRRLVSLPFADHAEPLLDSAWNAMDLNNWMRAERSAHHWKYVEIRPVSSERDSVSLLAPNRYFWLHSLDLSSSPQLLFSRLHKSCFQRRIVHAERQQLSYERGVSPQLISEFYRLLMVTRRRHRALPQPRSWFRNLAKCLGEKMQIRLVRRAGTPIAAILTLRHGRTVTYKYGCSDEKAHHVGGMPFLFWRVIEESKSEGAEQIDLGRTDTDNPGLIEFKDRLGAARRKLVYLRYPADCAQPGTVASRASASRVLFSALPCALSSAMGRIVYRHIG